MKRLILSAAAAVLFCTFVCAQTAPCNPYATADGRSVSGSSGIRLQELPQGGLSLTDIHDGDWAAVYKVDFGKDPAVLVSLETADFKAPGIIDFYLDAMEGEPVASMEIINDNMMKTAPVRAGVTGIHDLYLLFRGGEGPLFDLLWWKFNSHVNRPLVQTKYTADPAPMVWNGTVYLYTTHDEDDADGFKMFDWLCYTSTDMVNWTDHGAVASLADFAWYDGDNGAWAECVVERDGKFYMYCPIHGHGIGVLVADTPFGPFKDPLGKPLVWQREHWEDIDPSVFIDDDGQAYMYWGNPNVYWVKLGRDMVSTVGEIHKLDYKIEHYQEGPWFYKHSGKYYLAFASTCCPEGIGYAMSDSPEGPWKSMGHIMDRTWRTRGNHPGIIDYKGKSYIFGLNYEIMHLETFYHHERRSVSAAPMYYEKDGSIRKVPYWMDNVLEQIEPFDPFCRVEAETMAWGYGLKTRTEGEGIVLTHIDAGEHLQLKGVDFGPSGAGKLTARVLAPRGGIVDIRLDAEDGPSCGTLFIGPSREWSLQACPLKGTEGVHDLFFVFRAGGFEWDWWEMSR